MCRPAERKHLGGQRTHLGGRTHTFRGTTQTGLTEMFAYAIISRKGGFYQ